MRAARLLFVLVATSALAGCAGSAGIGYVPEPREPRMPDGVETSRTQMDFYTLSAETLTLDPLAPSKTVSVTLPERTVKAMVNLTFASGASSGFAFTGLSTCERRFEFTVIADGTTYGVDCGGVNPGAKDVIFSHEAGTVTVHVEFTALVCRAYAKCPTLEPTS